MVSTPDSPQRIVRLMPLAEARQSIDTLVALLPAREVDLRNALAATLAADVLAPAPRPGAAIALRDGYAVQAEATAGASTYSPIPLAGGRTVEVGERLPPDMDAVAPPDVVEVVGTETHILLPVASGEGVLPAGADADPEIPLRRAGHTLREIDIAVLASAGVTRVFVHAPRIRIIPARASGDGIMREAIELLDRWAVGVGGEVVVAQRTGTVPLEDVMAAPADVVFVVGGCGSGKRDHSVQTLARAGKVIFHGVGIAPGESAAFGLIGTTPVLIFPGRLDAVIAVWFTLAEPLLAKLCGRAPVEPQTKGTLLKKISSTIGLDEIVPVRREGDDLVPLPGGYLSMRTLTESDGTIIVPADREGFPEGTIVPVRLWT